MTPILFKSSFLLSISIILFITPLSNASSIVWIGAVNATSFKIHIDIPPQVTQLILSPHKNFSTITQTKDVTDSTSKIGDPWNGSNTLYGSLRRFIFTSLQPSTNYYVATRTPEQTIKQVATVRTFPEEGTPEELTLALGSCQRGAENDAAYEEIRFWYDKIRERHSFLMLHMGDLAYSDIYENNMAPYERALREVLQRDRVRSVFSTMPVPYMYDDHDYGVNNAGFASTSRPAALQNYRYMVPAYELPSREASYHAFTVGTVRIIMSDTRALADLDSGSTLGLSQREWFLRELEDASRYEVVVWMTSKPWIGENDLGKDSWAAYPAERLLISEKLAALNVTNLVAVAGDAHMLAVDDGRNTDYSGKGGGFAVFQAAPLSNKGSSKGGPYSQGCIAWKLFRNEQYGLLRITRLGKIDGPCVQFRGYKVGHKTQPEIEFHRCGQLSGVRGIGGQEDSCPIAVFPTWVYVVIILAVVWTLTMLVLLVVLCRYCFWRKRKPRANPKADSKDSERDTEVTEVTMSERTRSSTDQKLDVSS